MLIGLDKIADEPSARRICTLHPSIRQSAVDAFLAAMDAIRPNSLRVTYALRTFEEQDRLYAKGRMRLPDGSWRVEHPKGIVTNAKGGQSYHNYGFALDFVLLHPDGKPSWDVHETLDGDALADWTEVARAFTALGWEWGGDWNKFKDRPHVQKPPMHWKQLHDLWMMKRVDGEGYVLLG